jgi:hypothetical protein
LYLYFLLITEKSVTTENSVQIQFRFSSHSVRSQSVSSHKKKYYSLCYSELTISKNEFSSVPNSVKFSFSSVSAQFQFSYSVGVVLH